MISVEIEGEDRLYGNYTDSQIDSSYNEEPVYWCNNCNSLKIHEFECNVHGAPNLYCSHCNSFDIVTGSIFEWIDIAIPKDKKFKNLDEYKQHQRRVKNCELGIDHFTTEEDDNIRKEIEEEINSLYVLDMNEVIEMFL